MLGPTSITLTALNSRTHERTLGNKLSWLRSFAVTPLKRHSVNHNLRGEMIRDMINMELLIEVLILQRRLVDWPWSCAGDQYLPHGVHRI